MSPTRAANFLAQAAAALDYAHARNVVHRDVKPQNMLLRSGEDRLLLADFGIAKLLRETSALSQTRVTGTLAYMAPEQFQGQVSPATDIYALGCVAFQLLTGQIPYPGTSEQIMFGHAWGPLPQLAERGGAHLPPAVQEALSRALAKRPEDRFASAGALAQSLAQAFARPTVDPLAPTIQISSAPTERIAPPPTSPSPVATPATTTPLTTPSPVDVPPVAKPPAPTPPAVRNVSEAPARVITWGEAQTETPVERPRSSRIPRLLLVALGVVLVLLVGRAVLAPSNPPAATATSTAAIARVSTVPVSPPPQGGGTTTTISPATRTAQVAATATGDFVATETREAGIFRTFVAQSTATAAARAQNPSTVTASVTATTLGQVQARATADAWAAGSRIVFGPATGKLVHVPDDGSVVAQSTNVNLRDFIAEARITNPYPTAQGPWDFGFGFRTTGTDQGYRLVIRSNRTWEVALFFGNVTSGTQLVGSGTLENLDTSENGVNSVTLFVHGDSAIFFLNGVYVASFSAAGKMESGNISLATGLRGGDERAGAATSYTDFIVRSLP